MQTNRYRIESGPFDRDLDGRPEWVVTDATVTDDNGEPLRVAGPFPSEDAARAYVREQEAKDAAQPAPVTKDSPTVAVVEWAQARNLPAELVGRWVWVFFTTKPDAETREALKAAGFRFSREHDGRPAGWFHTCGHNRGRRRPVKGCDARALHGTVPVSDLEVA